MRRVLLPLLLGLLLPAAVRLRAATVRSAGPDAVSVTVYRAPRRTGALRLDDLQGFALISETRRVSLPAGESTLRFEGVAGGIQAASAIVAGLPEGVIEKNRDAQLLSPAALVAASLHRPVELERTNPKTGRTTRLRGTIESDLDGVLFRGDAGVEALRCSGLPETFDFEPFAGAAAVPTLSVRVRSPAPVTRTVTLSYLAGGFDWSATYTARLAADGTTLALGAWVTLANGNGESFAAAQTQVVAGRVNREAPDEAPQSAAGPILAECWPLGSTRDGTPLPVPAPPRREEFEPRMMMMRSLALAAPLAKRVVTPQVTQEQLGDLKLYRVPARTTVAARQMKQVRLLDQSDVPVRQVYTVLLAPGEPDEGSVRHELRTRNTRANHLGLPLPAGRVAVYAGVEPFLLLAEAPLPDHALDEELVIPLGESADLHVAVTTEQRTLDAARATRLPLLPGVALRSVGVQTTRRVELTNARPHDAEVEVGLALDGTGEAVVRADRPLERRSGRPTFTVRVPGDGHATLRFATARTADTVVRPR